MSKLLSYKVECSKGHLNIISVDNAYISATSDECGLCGSHGKVELDLYGANCEACNKPLKIIELSSW